MTELNLLNNEKLQKAAELARKNVARLKEQAGKPQARYYHWRPGERELPIRVEAVLTQTLGGNARFANPISLIDSNQPTVEE